MAGLEVFSCALFIAPLPSRLLSPAESPRTQSRFVT